MSSLVYEFFNETKSICYHHFSRTVKECDKSFGIIHSDEIELNIPAEFAGKVRYERGSYFVELLDEKNRRICSFDCRPKFPQQINKIENEGFADLTDTKKIIIDNGISIIGQKAFSNCPDLEKVVLPDSIISIQLGAFSNCQKLDNFVMRNNITKLDRYAFENCTGLKSIKLSSKIRAISQCAFRNCISLENIFIPDSVRKIKQAAFQGCINLKNVSIYAETEIDEGAFDQCPMVKITRR